MPDPLKPIFEVQLGTDPDGSFAWPSLDFAPDGKSLYIRQPVTHLSPWQYAQWYAPDIAGITLFLMLLLALIIARKVLRTPREPGKVYCRKCNYKLTPPLIIRDERGKVIRKDGIRCPECGSELSRTHPVIGTTSRRRLWPVWAVALPLIIASTPILWFTLQRYAPGSGYPTWPIPGVERAFSAIAVQKLPWWQRGSFPTSNRITRWSIPEGQRIGDAWMIETSGFYNGRLSSDGSVYINIATGADHATLELVCIDTATGKRRVAPLAATGGGADLIGFSPDGRTAYVQTVSNHPSAQPELDGWPLDVSLHAFDIHTLNTTEIAVITQTRSKVAGNWTQLYNRYVVDTTADPIRWALQTSGYDSTRAPTDARIIYFDGQDRREFTVPPMGKGWGEPRLLDNGKTLELNFYGVTAAATRLDPGHRGDHRRSQHRRQQPRSFRRWPLAACSWNHLPQSRRYHQRHTSNHSQHISDEQRRRDLRRRPLRRLHHWPALPPGAVPTTAMPHAGIGIWQIPQSTSEAEKK